jgi:hypothetical protein
MSIEQAIEWDVWGGDVDQEDGDHYATLGTYEEAVEYKAAMERINPRLYLRIQRQAKRAPDIYADPFADEAEDAGWRQSDFL